MESSDRREESDRREREPVLDVLDGWEPRTRYVLADGLTRGQAKARVAWDEGEAFTELRCRRVWLHEREITEDDAAELWMDDWYPGYVAWIGCAQDAAGATAWWELKLP